MKSIHFIRHAKSSWSSGASRDIDRPLNSRGKRDAPVMAKRLKDKGVIVDGIVKSPAQRITETIVPFVELFDITADQIITEPKIYEGSLSDILDVVQSVPADWNSIFLFGHNPAMTYLAEYFGRTDILNVPTCGILHVMSDSDTWTYMNESNSKIDAYYYPKQEIV